MEENSDPTDRVESPLREISAWFATVWHIALCLLCYALFLVALIPMLPFIAVFNILRVTERVLVKMTSGQIALTGIDALGVPCTDENHVIINVLHCFENKGCLGEAINNFRQAILERLVNAKKADGELVYPRVRWYVRPGRFQYFFQEDQSFKIENHVFKWEGEVPRSKDELEAIVSKLNNEPFSAGRSPWYYCCVPTCFGDNDIAVVFRIKHYVADGISVSKYIAYNFPDQKGFLATPQKFSTTERTLLLAKGLLLAPMYLFKLILASADQSILHGPQLCGVKKVAWHKAVELKLIKEIKTVTGTTVNDVLMSCISLALRRYFQKKGDKHPADFTASVAADVRLTPASLEELSFENKFSFVFPKLPVATEGAEKQLYEAKARMDKVKFSGDPWASYVVLLTSHYLFPEFLSTKVNSFCMNKASCILSNVPGSQHEVSVKGIRMKSVTFWPPNFGNIAVTISICSFDGQVFVGVQGDACVLSDPGVIIEEFGNAVHEMARCVLRSNGSISN